MELQIFGTLLFTAVRTRDAMSGAEMIACAVTRKTVISQGSRSTSWTLSEAALTEWRAGAVRSSPDPAYYTTSTEVRVTGVADLYRRKYRGRIQVSLPRIGLRISYAASGTNSGHTFYQVGEKAMRTLSGVRKGSTASLLGSYAVARPCPTDCPLWSYAFTSRCPVLTARYGPMPLLCDAQY
eukprot:2387141-Rhodomonas_salina.5